VDAVHADLRAAVLDGRLEPGVQLSVPRLARELAVSRGPVREAVLQLVADGLAQERPRRGVVVATLDYEQTQQIHRVREVLEGLAARMCAEETRPGLVESLRAVLAEHSDGGDSESYARGDQEFHRFLAEACGNSVLTELINRLHAQMQIALVRAADDANHRRQGWAELGVVLEAIRRRDPPAAEAAMRAHIERTRRLLHDNDTPRDK
jgi:DNA-binding GntR family transcriptional regulator